MLLHASAKFGRMLRGAWALPDVSIADLAAADVSDWDPRGCELAVGCGARRRRVPLSDEAKAVMNEAIGFRTAGPIFVPIRAERFHRELVQLEFRDLRGRASIPPEVKLRRRQAAAVEITRGSQGGGLESKGVNAITRT